MSKLDPGLKLLMTSAPDEMTAFANDSMFSLEVEPAQPARANVLAQFTGDAAALEAAGFRIRTRAGNIVSGDIDVDRIGNLENVDGLTRAEVSRVLGYELDLALPEARVTSVHAGPPGRRGAGVIVAMIDSGIDYQHPAFRDALGQSRILAIWDQALVPQPGEQSPAPFTYGVEYRMQDINLALASAVPFARVRHQDDAAQAFHGTHVSGISAGNGRPAQAGQLQPAFVGVAPEADIVVVANNRGRAEGERGLGDSADTLDAVQYILSIAAAQGRPVVINQSQGDNVGAHDGTSLLERGIANLIAGAGRVLVKSAGNEGARARHAQGTAVLNTAQAVRFTVPGGTREVVIDLWYPGADRIECAIVPPNGTSAAAVAPPTTTTINLSNGNAAFVDADLDDPGNHDNRTFVRLSRGSQTAVAAGTWTLRLTPTAVADGRWHAWIQRNSGSRFLAPFVNASSTISIPGTSPAVITVGSYLTRGGTPVGRLSDFSSRGPTRDGRQAPTLAAPGEELMATLPPSPPGSFGLLAGTSMASPMVAGTVALILQQHPNATAAAIRACLEQTARRDTFTGGAPGNEWGAGKLDAQAACAVVIP
ncbi:MAG TPA: S8 family peptidase [Vicinamibacterales bacterium]|jgi:subtilisin family serine protease